jgi:hypothetical protein
MVLEKNLNTLDIGALKSFLVEDDILSKLAAIKQDAKNFKLQMMAAERRKLAILTPAYQIIKRLLPELKLSQ